MTPTFGKRFIHAFDRTRNVSVEAEKRAEYRMRRDSKIHVRDGIAVARNKCGRRQFIFTIFAARHLPSFACVFSRECLFLLLRAMQATMSTGLGLTPTIEKLLFIVRAIFRSTIFHFGRRSMLLRGAWAKGRGEARQLVRNLLRATTIIINFADELWELAAPDPPASS